MGRARASSRKRKAESSAPKDGESGSSRSPDEASKAKRLKTPARKESEEPEYFPEKRNLVANIPLYFG